MAKKLNIDLEKNSSLFGLFAVALAVLAVGFVAAKTLFDVAQFNGRVISERREVQGVISQNLNNSGQLIANYEQLKEQNLGPNVLFQIMSTEYDFAGFTSILSAAAQSSGVQLVSISPGSSQADSVNEISEELDVQPTSFEVSMSVEGSYKDITNFITNLQRAAQPIEIQTIDLSGQGNELTADIFISSYYQQRIGIDAGEEEVR